MRLCLRHNVIDHEIAAIRECLQLVLSQGFRRALERELYQGGDLLDFLLAPSASMTTGLAAELGVSWPTGFG